MDKEQEKGRERGVQVQGKEEEKQEEEEQEEGLRRSKS